MFETLKNAVTQMRDYVARKSTSTPWWILMVVVAAYVLSLGLLLYLGFYGEAAKFEMAVDLFKELNKTFVGTFLVYAGGGLIKRKIDNGNGHTIKPEPLDD